MYSSVIAAPSRSVNAALHGGTVAEQRDPVIVPGELS